ncbi:MAG: serine/threonine-protein kinase [Planctomycetia bacterium]|nr:serine/threonine-protein kinase [Planctomycetia bacterium]
MDSNKILSPEEFLSYLDKSDLVEKDRLKEALVKIRDTGTPENLANAQYIAEKLKFAGLITDWHIHQLMKKKYKGFFLRQYRILDHLGSGGMSTVYLAEHTVMHRQVAIKVLPKKRLSNSAYLERFVREAQAIASLDHPHVVRAYDIDRVDDVHYIVMEYFNGINLRQLVERDGPLPFENAASYIMQAALGLVHAHRIGVIHRDVKPDNLLVNQDGLVKLLDLGLALLDENVFRSGSSMSEEKVLGTADYLAPEQAINSHEVDARADIYGLGGTLYFCLTGHPPFPFGTIPQRLLAHQNEEPASILIDRPEAPDDIINICSKMMAKDPAQRFQTAQEVVQTMQGWLIRHGFATEKDFPDSVPEEDRPMSEEDLLLQQASDLAGNNQLGLKSDSEFRTTFSSTWGSGSSAILPAGGKKAAVNGHSSQLDLAKNDTNPSDNFFFSSESILPSNNEYDPADLAMADLEPSRSQAESAPIRPNPDQKKMDPSSSGKTPIVRTSSDQKDHRRGSSPNGKTHLQKSPERSFSQKSEEQDQNFHSETAPVRHHWSQVVPFWFWAVFVAGYILAFFFAGILFALLLKLSVSLSS